jgi:ParB family chromosome partitioning protein
MMESNVVELPLDELRPGRYQPRLQLLEEGLAELAGSIREQGVLQPLIVREIAAGARAEVKYEIVTGERRWRAARLAGLATVPAFVRDLSDKEALAVALVENLQREDLNPLEQAISMSRLTNEFAMTHDEIAKALGRSRASVTNFLRLLDLADDVKDAIADGSLDMGHARALLPLDDKRQVVLARRIVSHGWSVRMVEDTVRNLLERPVDLAEPKPVDLQTRWLERQLTRELGEKVSVRPGPKGEYVLKLEFADLASLDASLERLHDLVRQVRAVAGPRVREAVRDPQAQGGET